MLVELLQPTGPDLARRWLAALLSIPRDERMAAVEAIEQRIATLYASHEATADTDGSVEFHVVSPPVQHDGYTEHTETTYQTRPTSSRSTRSTRKAR